MRQHLFSQIFKGSRQLWAILAVFCVVSIIALHTASSQLVFKVGGTSPVFTHMLFIVTGIGWAALLSHMKITHLRRFAYIALAVAILLQLLTFTGLGVTINHARRWVRIPLIHFTIQPSEFIKPFLVIVIADLLAHIKDEETQKRYLSIIIALVILCAGLILPSNLSTAILIIATAWILLFIAQIPFKKLLIMIGVLALAGVAGYGMIKIIPKEKMPKILERAYTWESRFDRFLGLGDAVNDDDDNYQIKMGKAAIANGRYTGVGIGNSKMRTKVPLAYADSIYAIIVEELGLIGAIGIILMYLWLLYQAGRIARRNAKTFSQLAVMGLALVIVLQAFISMAVVVDLGPTTGQPLPLISRGGTSVWATCFYFGCIFAIDEDTKTTSEREKQVLNESLNDVPDIDITT